MLTEEQIQALYRFCEKHFVYYYEVQVELVDHLANAIEEEMKQDTRLTFEMALDKVYARFGVMGFSTVVKEKTAQLDKSYRREYRKLILHQFHWPQVLIFLLVSTLLYTVFNLDMNAGLILLSVIGLVGWVVGMVETISFSKFVKKSKKNFLGVYNYFQVLTTWLPLYISLETFVFAENLDVTIHPVVMSLTGAFYVVLFIASGKLTRQNKERLVREFPEVFRYAN